LIVYIIISKISKIVKHMRYKLDGFIIKLTSLIFFVTKFRCVSDKAINWGRKKDNGTIYLKDL